MNISTSTQRLARLVLLLNDKTNAGEIQWAGTDHHSVFRAEISKNAIEIREATDESGLPSVELAIFNSKGDRVDVFDDTLFSNVDNPLGYTGYFSLMTDLLNTAKRQCSGAEQTVSELLSQLNDDMPF